MKRLWLPWYWPTWLLFAGCWCVARLPMPAQYAFGRWLARLFFTLLRRRKSVIRVNLQLAFPELSFAEREERTRQTIDEFSKSVVETMFVWFRGVEPLLDRINITGLEYLSSDNPSQGTILLGAHFASLDLCGAAVSHHVPFQITYRDIKNPVVNYFAVSRRRRDYERTYRATQLRTLVAELGKGNTIWFACDQDMGTRKATCFAPFFGVQASTITTPFRLARIAGARVVLMAHSRDEAEQVWNVSLSPIELSSLKEPECYFADATVVNAAIEQVIRSQPTQYFWVHRRFKTMETGERRDYGDTTVNSGDEC